MSSAPIVDWIRATAHPVAAPSDLRPLLHLVADSVVVGIGAGTRAAHELAELQLQVTRLLVEDAGFRAVPLDADWAVGLELDRYVRDRYGEPADVLAAADPIWHTVEMRALVDYLREFNQRHQDDPVRVVGANVTEMRNTTYDAVADYVRSAAGPERCAELESLLSELRRGGPSQEQPSRARALAAALPAGHDGHALAVQHANVIAAYHQLQSYGERMQDPRQMAFLEHQIALNITWWQQHTGQKVIFWSASTHTANGATRAVRFPPHPPRVHRNAGSHLRDRFGTAYTSIGLTFHDGDLANGGKPPHRVRAADPELVESILGATGIDTYLLDLHADRPSQVATWLTRPALTRVIGPTYDAAIDGAHNMSGGSLGEWFDVMVHRQHVTPTRPLTTGSATSRSAR